VNPRLFGLLWQYQITDFATAAEFSLRGLHGSDDLVWSGAVRGGACGSVALQPLFTKCESRPETSADIRSTIRPHGPQGATIITDLTQLIYASQPFGYDSAILGSILLDARRCNARDGITGALVCRHDIYLQLLEGPSEQVNAAYMRIYRDDRHAGIQKLVSRQITSRMFGDWAMLHDPAKSLIWTQDEIAAGILERTTPAEIIRMFENLSETAGSDPSR
jgi:hypothetical protein